MYIVSVFAIYGSFDGLDGLAVSYGGWPGIAGLVLPGTLDAYWLNALRVALKAKAAKRVGAFLHTAIAFALSVFGNILFHELHSGQWHLGHYAPLVVAVISSVPLVAAAAMTHLQMLRPQPETEHVLANVNRTRRPHRRGAPANRTSTGPADRTSTAPQARQPSAPAHRANAPGDRSTSAPQAHQRSAPVTRHGSRPDPEVRERAAEIFRTALHEENRIHNRRTLRQAVNDYYRVTDGNVIGDRACQTVIDEHQRRSA